MNKEDREWLDRLISENKESDEELTYTYCPFRVLYQLQQENNQLKERIEYLERSNNRREETILDLRSENVDLATKIDKLEDKIKQMDNRFKNGLCVDNYLGGRKTRKLFEEMYEILKDSDVDE